MFPVEKALDYINNRHVGYFAFVCADGLLFRSESVWTSPVAEERGIEPDDRVEEDFAVFQIVDGLVDIRAVREFMGY